MKKHSEGFLAIVRDAKSRIRETDVSTVFKDLQEGKIFHLIDVREREEWLRGSLPQSIHIGKGVLERDIESKIPNYEDEVILYCGGGYRSALAAENLIRMGYTNVSSMDGGYRGWTTAHYPIIDPVSD